MASRSSKRLRISSPPCSPGHGQPLGELVGFVAGGDVDPGVEASAEASRSSGAWSLWASAAAAAAAAAVSEQGRVVELSSAVEASKTQGVTQTKFAVPAETWEGNPSPWLDAPVTSINKRSAPPGRQTTSRDKWQDVGQSVQRARDRCAGGGARKGQEGAGEHKGGHDALWGSACDGIEGLGVAEEGGELVGTIAAGSLPTEGEATAGTMEEDGLEAMEDTVALWLRNSASGSDEPAEAARSQQPLSPSWPLQQQQEQPQGQVKSKTHHLRPHQLQHQQQQEHQQQREQQEQAQRQQSAGGVSGDSSKANLCVGRGVKSLGKAGPPGLPPTPTTNFAHFSRVLRAMDSRSGRALCPGAGERLAHGFAGSMQDLRVQCASRGTQPALTPPQAQSRGPVREAQGTAPEAFWEQDKAGGSRDQDSSTGDLAAGGRHGEGSLLHGAQAGKSTSEHQGLAAVQGQGQLEAAVPTSAASQLDPCRRLGDCRHKAEGERQAGQGSCQDSEQSGEERFARQREEARGEATGRGGSGGQGKTEACSRISRLYVPLAQLQEMKGKGEGIGEAIPGGIEPAMSPSGGRVVQGDLLAWQQRQQQKKESSSLALPLHRSQWGEGAVAGIGGGAQQLRPGGQFERTTEPSDNRAEADSGQGRGGAAEMPRGAFLEAGAQVLEGDAAQAHGGSATSGVLDPGNAMRGRSPRLGAGVVPGGKRQEAESCRQAVPGGLQVAEDMEASYDPQGKSKVCGRQEVETEPAELAEPEQAWQGSAESQAGSAGPMYEDGAAPGAVAAATAAAFGLNGAEQSDRGLEQQEGTRDGQQQPPSSPQSLLPPPPSQQRNQQQEEQQKQPRRQQESAQGSGRRGGASHTAGPGVRPEKKVEESEEGNDRRSRAAIHNQSERRRRDRINERMKALQELIPNANKTDKASMLDEAIDYLKFLQHQLQVMSVHTGIPIPTHLRPASSSSAASWAGPSSLASAIHMSMPAGMPSMQPMPSSVASVPLPVPVAGLPLASLPGYATMLPLSSPWLRSGLSGADSTLLGPARGTAGAWEASQRGGSSGPTANQGSASAPQKLCADGRQWVGQAASESGAVVGEAGREGGEGEVAGEGMGVARQLLKSRGLGSLTAVPRSSGRPGGMVSTPGISSASPNHEGVWAVPQSLGVPERSQVGVSCATPDEAWECEEAHDITQGQEKVHGSAAPTLVMPSQSALVPHSWQRPGTVPVRSGADAGLVRSGSTPLQQRLGQDGEVGQEGKGGKDGLQVVRTESALALADGGGRPSSSGGALGGCASVEQPPGATVSSAATASGMCRSAAVRGDPWLLNSSQTHQQQQQQHEQKQQRRRRQQQLLQQQGQPSQLQGELQDRFYSSSPALLLGRQAAEPRDELVSRRQLRWTPGQQSSWRLASPPPAGIGAGDGGGGACRAVGDAGVHEWGDSNVLGEECFRWSATGMPDTDRAWAGVAGSEGGRGREGVAHSPRKESHSTYGTSPVLPGSPPSMAAMLQGRKDSASPFAHSLGPAWGFPTLSNPNSVLAMGGATGQVRGEMHSARESELREAGRSLEALAGLGSGRQALEEQHALEMSAPRPDEQVLKRRSWGESFPLLLAQHSRGAVPPEMPPHASNTGSGRGCPLDGSQLDTPWFASGGGALVGSTEYMRAFLGHGMQALQDPLQVGVAQGNQRMLEALQLKQAWAHSGSLPSPSCSLQRHREIQLIMLDQQQQHQQQQQQQLKEQEQHQLQQEQQLQDQRQQQLQLNGRMQGRDSLSELEQQQLQQSQGASRGFLHQQGTQPPSQALQDSQSQVTTMFTG